MKFATQRFDPDRHSAFVYSEVRRAAMKFPYSLPGVLEHVMQHRLSELVRRAITVNPRGSLVAVADDDPDLFLGFVVSPGPQQICFAYTKYALRHQGICTETCAALGVDLSLPTSVQIWSPAASRIAAAGYRIYPAIPSERDNGNREQTAGE